MLRIRVRPFMPAGRLAYMLLVLTSCVAAALIGSTWLLGEADASSQGPIAAYSMDAGSGSTLEDVTGAKHEGTIEGATWTPRGKYGSALEFDGTNDCVKIANAEDLQLSEEFTLEAWVRPTGAEQTLAPILAKEAEKFFSYSLFLGVFESGHLEGFAAKSASTYAEVASGEALPAKTWSHVAFTSDGAHLRLYVDGALLDTASALEIAESKGPLYLGCAASGSPHFKGKIDEVRLYDRALSGAEVGDDMNAELETPRSGPVAAYAFDEDEGTTAHDNTGNGHDGTIEGAEWTRGKFGAALEFNSAEEDVVTIPTSPDLDLEDFTLEAWVKPTEIHSFAPVIAKAGSEGYGYELMAGGDEEPPLPEGWITNGESVHRYSYSENQLDEKAWTHIAVTSDGAKMRFYLNGQLVDTENGDNPITGGEYPLQIGGDDSFAPAQWFDGKIDEVRIYDRALSEAEVGTDLHSGIETPQQGPIAAYSMDAGSGSTLEDLTGAEHEGTIEGAEWKPGKYGQALGFDGTNDCVKIPNTEDLQLSEEFTLEAWVRPTGEQSFAPIFFKEIESSSFYSYSLFLGVFEAGALEGFVSKEWPNWGEVSSGEPLTPDRWSHVAFTSDGAHLRLYVNGDLVGTGNAEDIGESEGPLYLGCWPENNEHYQGKIDEVRVYDRALDGSEVGADLGDPLQTPRSGPVAAYAFDEDEGTTAHDNTGNGHDGTIEGAEWTRGKFGAALEFDSSKGDVVTIPTSPDLNLEDFTLEAWVKPSEIHRYEPVIAKTGTEGYGYELMAGGDEPSALPEGFITQGKSVDRYTYAEHQLDEDAWTHIAFTSDGDQLRFYVDGELVDTRTGHNVFAGEEDALQIGGDESPYSEFFDGKIDEVRIYDRALGQGEIAADQHTGIETPQQAPIAAYSFDETEGSTVEDVTGSGHEGTIEGATRTAKGKYGSALEFDGENECVKIPESAEFEFLENEEFTLEAWVRPTGEGIQALVTQEDNSPEEWEEPFSYSMLVGGEEGPKGWFRRGGEEGHEGVQAPDPLPDNAWSHLAVTDDGARLRIYVNGENVGSEAAIPLTEAEGPLSIGCLANYGNYFKGRIDEVRIYDRALDGGELLQGMAAGFPVATTQPTSEVDANYAIMLGDAEAKSNDAEFFFEYGLTKAYGETVEGEEIDEDTEETQVSEAAINLMPETEYHYRLVVNSPVGTARGKDQTFTTGKRTKTVEEEAALSKAEAKMEITPAEVVAGPGDFYGMMWTGDLQKMQNQNIWEAVERSGAKAVRFAIYPDPARQPEITKAFEEATKHNLMILPYFGSGPFPKPGSSKANNWYLYAKKMIEEYGPDSTYKVGTWEIWNEPNLSHQKEVKDTTQEQGGGRHPEEFGEFFRAMAEALENNSVGDVEILTPGLYGFRGNGCKPECHLTPRKFLARMGSVNAYDAISLHPYVPSIGKRGEKHAPKTHDEVLRNTEAIKRVITSVHAFRNGEKPLWITELGFPVANPDGNTAKVPPVRKAIQAELVQAAFSMMENNRHDLGIEHAFYYDIQDDEKKGWEYHSGLLEVSGHIRPAWNAYKNLALGKKCPHEAVPC